MKTVNDLNLNITRSQPHRHFVALIARLTAPLNELLNQLLNQPLSKPRNI